MPGSSPGLRGHCFMHRGCMISRCEQPCRMATAAFPTRVQVFFFCITSTPNQFPTKAVQPVIEACSWPLPFAAGTTNACRSISTSLYTIMTWRASTGLKPRIGQGCTNLGRQTLVRWHLILVAQNSEVTPKIWGYLSQVGGVGSSVYLSRHTF